jgi:hypothetical protein
MTLPLCIAARSDYPSSDHAKRYMLRQQYTCLLTSPALDKTFNEISKLGGLMRRLGYWALRQVEQMGIEALCTLQKVDGMYSVENY